MIGRLMARVVRPYLRRTIGPQHLARILPRHGLTRPVCHTEQRAAVLRGTLRCSCIHFSRIHFSRTVPMVPSLP
jgi:hypothetical protein